MSRPKGTPKTGGRKKGTPNTSSMAIKAHAQRYGPRVLEQLAALAFDLTKSESARVAAMREILDRAYGKSPVSHEVPEGQQAAVQTTTTIITGVPRE